MEVDDEKGAAPVASPDGKRQAYIKNDNVYVSDRIGRHERALSNDGTAGNYYSSWLKWSPDGKYLYYASARFVRKDTIENLDNETILRYKDIKYNLFRRSFDPASRRIGPPELVFDAAAFGKSATLPRISPDGHYLMFTLGEFGVFHIWHKDADLYLMDLRTRQVRPMTEINSDDVESYHSWSSNGRWVVFSSRRYDGNYTRPYIAYID